MNISKLVNIYILLLSALVVTACGGGGGGGGGPAVAPKDAIVLDASNAEPTVQEAITASDAIAFKGATSTATVGSAIDSIRDLIRTKAKNTGVDLVSGVALSETVSCTDFITPATAGAANTATANINYTYSDPSYSESGTVSFVSCTPYVGPVTLAGSLSFNGTANYSTGAYTDNATGNLTVTTLGATFSISNFAVNESGNFLTGDYVTTKLQYTYNPSSLTGGFAVNMTTNMSGNYFDCGPTAGVIVISGANSTKVRVTFNPDQSMTVEVDAGTGTYAAIPASPIACF